MFRRIFLLNENEETREQAQTLADFFCPGEKAIVFHPYHAKEKPSFETFGEGDLRRLVFVGPCSTSQLGAWTVAGFVRSLAEGIWPPVDKSLVEDLYLIDTSTPFAFNPEKKILIQSLADELEKNYFLRVRVHALPYVQAFQASKASRLHSAETTYLPREADEDRAKRIRVEKAANVPLLFQPKPSPVQSQSPDFIELMARVALLCDILFAEIQQLRARAKASCISFFIQFEINTKLKKLGCLQDLTQANNLAELKEKAQHWSQDRRVRWRWRNTREPSWFESRTGNLLTEIEKYGEMKEEETAELSPRCKGLKN